MNITIAIKTSDRHDEGQHLAAQLRKLANQVEDWPGRNEFQLGILGQESKRVGYLTATFDSCPQCQDRPGYNGVGELCRTCRGTGRLSPFRKIELGLETA